MKKGVYVSGSAKRVRKWRSESRVETPVEMDEIAKYELSWGTAYAANISGIADALGDWKKNTPIGSDIQACGEERAQVSQDIEVLALHDAIGLRSIGNGKVGRDVKEFAESSHDVAGEIWSIVTTQVKGRTVPTEDSEKRFCSRLSRIVYRRNQFDKRREAAYYHKDINLTASRRRKRTKCINGNQNEWFI